MTNKLFVFCVLSLLVVSVRAQTISYQGMLAKDGLTVPDGDYTITVTIYHDSLGVSSAWSGWYPVHTTNGVFNVLLGSGDYPLPPATKLDGPLFVGLRIGASAELPLTQLSQAVSALNVADGSITARKMGTDYVSQISVNGQKVTGNGTGLNIVGNVMYDDASKSLVLNGGSLTTDSSGKGANPEWVGDLGGGNWDALGVTPFNAVAGGQHDTANGATNGHASVLGGQGNNALGPWSAVGGGYKNRATGEYSTVAGGDSNFAIGLNSAILGGIGNKVTAIGSSIVGGDSNIIDVPSSDSNQSFIGGGSHDSIMDGGEQKNSVIVGGMNNKIVEGPSFIGGGQSNVILQEEASIVGGSNNKNDGDWSFIGGGDHNTILADDLLFLRYWSPYYQPDGVSSIVGGLQNTTTANADFIGGGYLNTINGDLSAIPGGISLTLDGHSFGFNGDTTKWNPVVTDLSGFQSVAYFGNVNMMIGNVDNLARQLQFYSPNKSHDYAFDTAFYSSFKAGTQFYNINYTWPDSLPLPGQFLKAASVGIGNSVTLKWATDIDTGSGGGGGLSGWLLTGNSLVPTPTNYLGTQDSEAFEIHIHNNTLDTTGGNQRVMRYEEGPTSPNIIGGSSANVINTGLSGAAILSGGSIGEPNSVSDTFSVIAGGENNTVDAGATHAVISGGESNETSSEHSAVSGGETNHAGGPFSYIGGGGGIEAGGGGGSSALRRSLSPSFSSPFILTGNKAGAPYTTICAGGGNEATDTLASILGGEYNAANGYASVIGGGGENVVEGRFSSVTGGFTNKTDGDYSIITGGLANNISSGSTYSVISGGDSNSISGPRSFIGSGCFNQVITTKWGTIAGGCGNVVSDTLTFIGGGNENTVAASESAIAGGESNFIHTSDTEGAAKYGAIGGGSNNEITDSDLSNFFAFTPFLLPQHATIAGGTDNKAEGQFSAMGGGRQNFALGIYSTVPGGIGLIASDYQTVIGRYNLQSGSIHNSSSVNKLPFASHPGGNDTSEVLPHPDFPIFIIGNGRVDDSHNILPSNAFTVRDTGYSSCYYNVGTGNFIGGTPTRIGSTYSPNTIEAWGNVKGGDTVVDDIGAGHVYFDTVGTYTVVLNIRNQDGSPHTFTPGGGAITVSLGLNNAGGPGQVAVSQLLTVGGDGITPTTPGFIVTTFNASGTVRSSGYGFQFHVVAR